MRSSILLAYLLLIGLLPAAQQPNNALSGIVRDSAGHKPLADVSVFLNNTTRGTATQPDGSFLLPDIPPGAYQLIFSSIGYETLVMNINGSRLPGPLNITLHQQSTELAAVTVEPYDPDGWTKWGQLFLDYFIGIGENASRCSIRNREAVRFRVDRLGTRLRVTATEPLLIENDALGYLLEYRLEEFVVDFHTNVVSFFGYPFFREMTPKKERQQRIWIRNRQKTYLGSRLHFMRSLYTGSLLTNGFAVKTVAEVPNWEKLRVRTIYRSDSFKRADVSWDTLSYYRETLKTPDSILKITYLSPGDLVCIDSAMDRKLRFDGTLVVTFKADPYSVRNYSGMSLTGKSPITVEQSGYYYPPRAILTYGNWAFRERIAYQLPLDYGL